MNTGNTNKKPDVKVEIKLYKVEYRASLLQGHLSYDKSLYWINPDHIPNSDPTKTSSFIYDETTKKCHIITSIWWKKSI